VGYDLTRLLVGSEWTLGIITKATLRLLPLPEAASAVLAFFRSAEEAARAVALTAERRILPSAMELMDRAALECAGAGLAVPEGAGCALLIEVDGRREAVDREASGVEAILRECGAMESRRAADGAARERLWALRRAISPSLRRLGAVKINEDIVVPRTRLPEMFSFLSALAARKGLRIVTFGHAGDGNIHVNIMISGTDAQERRRADEAVEEVFRRTLDLGGTISGEHGVGISKAPFLEMEVGPLGVEVMRRIKACFDPKGILNPGKIFAPEPRGAAGGTAA